MLCKTTFQSIVTIDLYCSRYNEGFFEKQLDSYFKDGKPVAITEYGCCPVSEGADLGGNATFVILTFKDERLVVNPGWQYNEQE